MDHMTAIENHTAERYLMGDLNEEDRDAYEEHFFSCAACAEEIKSASAFIESARRLVQDELRAQAYGAEYRQAKRRSWLNWGSLLQPIPAAACALLLMVGGFAVYQATITVPRLNQMASALVIPQNTVQMVLTQSHGEKEMAQAGKPLLLRFAVPAPDGSVASFNSCKADIVTESYARKFSFDISLQELHDPVQVFLNAGALQPGKYFMIVRGVKSDGKQDRELEELARLPFEIGK